MAVRCDGAPLFRDLDDNVVLDLSPLPNQHDSPFSDSRFNRSFSRKGSQKSSGFMSVAVAGETMAGAPRQEGHHHLAGPLETQGSEEEGQGQQHQHKITITTANIPSVDGEGIGFNMKRCRSARSHRPFWYPSPHRVLFFFATLSSMGTMVLLLMTMTTGQEGVEGENGN